MKAKDLRERTAEELVELEKTLLRERFENRFKNFTNRLDNTAVLRKARRDIARVKTLLSEKSATEKTATAKAATDKAATATAITTQTEAK